MSRVMSKCHVHCESFIVRLSSHLHSLPMNKTVSKTDPLWACDEHPKARWYVVQVVCTYYLA